MGWQAMLHRCYGRADHWLNEMINNNISLVIIFLGKLVRFNLYNLFWEFNRLIAFEIVKITI